MEILQELEVVRFFPTKLPVSLLDKNETLRNYSIGIDLYMPEMSDEFLTTLCTLNYLTKDTFESEIVGRSDSGEIVFSYYNVEGFEHFKITKPLTIPTGIGFKIPEDYWCEIRSKSSNLSNGFTIVHGTVDMNYTYGVGAQIIPLDSGNRAVILKPHQKICQVVFHKANPVLTISEIPLNDWNEDHYIKKLRDVRTGGFGSTGKM